MALSKKDLEAIDGLLAKRINPLNKKFEELFNFLDEKYLDVKRDVRKLQKHLHLPVSDF